MGVLALKGGAAFAVHPIADVDTGKLLGGATDVGVLTLMSFRLSTA